MNPIVRCAAIAAFIAVGSSPALAFSPADYGASFKMTSGNLSLLKTGNPLFDGDRVFTGNWLSNSQPDARTGTLDLASFSTGPDGQSFIPTWGDYGHDDNRGRGGLGPLSFGESFAYACGSPGGCATGSHTASTSQVFHDYISAKVSLTDLYAKANTQASWTRSFALDPFASFTFSGLATVSITGDEAPLQGATRIRNDSDAWMTVSSMTFGDLLGRVNAVLGTSLWGDNSAFADIDYTMGADGLMSMTITNNSNATLLGQLNAGAYVDLSPPIPEPATWLMLMAGAGLVGVSARRRAGRRSA
jgi:hypothetical protein